MSVFASAIAVAWYRRRDFSELRVAYALSAIIMVGALAYGSARLALAAQAATLPVGLAVIDTVIDPHASARDELLANYGKAVAALAQQGAQIVREIGKFLMNGGLYKGAKPVMWSVVEQTALAEAEIEYHDHTSTTVWARFPVAKPSRPELAGASVVIWTTTPWTLPANLAVAYNSTFGYSMVRHGEEKFVVSTALLVTRMGESKDSEAHSEPGGISGNDDVRAAVRTPGRARNRSSAFAYTS